jgi:hypothetical protein
MASHNAQHNLRVIAKASMQNEEFVDHMPPQFDIYIALHSCSPGNNARNIID